MIVKFQTDEATNEASVSIDDRTFKLDWDFPAIYTFYRVTGVNVILEPAGSDPFRLIALLWVGLLASAPEIEIKEVQGWFNARTAPMLYKGVIEALKASMPESTEGESAPADPQSA